MKSLFLIALLPPEQLSEQIDGIRKECSEKYNVYAALKPPVHLTLYRTIHIEQHLEKHLEKVLMQATHRDPFTVTLENFDSFNNQTLFINCIKSPPLAALQKSISAIISRNRFDPREVKGGNTLFKPHITIAYRDVSPEIFPVMWDEYKSRKFKREFPVHAFTLLKHNGKQWQPVKHYNLVPQNESLTLF
ncbi:2'-5' RNA ligase family protein [Pedobacter sp. BS3]|uniref:2'-5' RNA ligase family protein n=1 Tax=Pedobacter sp. BS3 TaxID=2567937 RepID=UPI0011EEBEEA|nr:2'-5' RNA ligase family protein [Pedobacter sp. BS3]TZF84632.1 2'-5' RNA ligase family protein [Pedobacter sp. BS3]